MCGMDRPIPAISRFTSRSMSARVIRRGTAGGNTGTAAKGECPPGGNVGFQVCVQRDSGKIAVVVASWLAELIKGGGAQRSVGTDLLAMREDWGSGTN